MSFGFFQLGVHNRTTHDEGLGSDHFLNLRTISPEKPRKNPSLTIGVKDHVIRFFRTRSTEQEQRDDNLATPDIQYITYR